MKYILYIFCSLIIVSCSSGTHHPANQKEKQISIPLKKAIDTSVIGFAIAHGGCEGRCPVETYQVDSGLSVMYFGSLYASKRGFYKGKMDREIWPKLKHILDTFPARKLLDSYPEIMDAPKLQLVINYANGKKDIKGYYQTAPYKFYKIHNLLFKILSSVKLKPTKESLKFETTVLSFDR